MPFQPEHSLLRIEVPGLRTIDTTSVENLYGMWSLFSKASHAMEDGKRLENLSWRLWNRETFCCTRQAGLDTPGSVARDIPMPPLSTSLRSADSDDLAEDDDSDAAAASIQRPARASVRFTPLSSRSSVDPPLCCASTSRTPKHITPIDLEKMVLSIRETDLREPIELPAATLIHTVDSTSPAVSSNSNCGLRVRASTRRPVPHPSSQPTLLESSSSTLGTNGSQASDRSQTVGSESSSATEISTHSIVRGFTPGGAPSSYRSQTNLNTHAAPLPSMSGPSCQPVPKKKTPMFTIGTCSDDDHDSSLESEFKGTLSESLSRPGILQPIKKQPSFKNELAAAKARQHSPVFESDDEDEEVSESAIEDDDDSSDWEDSDDGSRSSSVHDKDLFQRVDSRPNLTSRRSLLTTMIHEPDRAKALANAASRSSPAIRRSRNATPNGPSVGTSPELGSQLMCTEQSVAREKPAIMTTSNTLTQTPAVPLSSSPRTNRRQMLQQELTESLRRNLLWERQHKSTGNLAALKRRHTSNDVKNLRQHPEPPSVALRQDRSRFTNAYFDAGLGQYHEKGW